MLQVFNVLVQQQGGVVVLILGCLMVEFDVLIYLWWLLLVGVYGVECCDINGKIYIVFLLIVLCDEIVVELMLVLEVFLGCELESKEMVFVFYYCQVLQQQSVVLELVQWIVQCYLLLVLQFGKCVVEIKFCGVNKGEVIIVFMQEVLFVGCELVFVGDDLIDEVGFSVVN